MKFNGLGMLFRLSTILFFLSLIMCFLIEDVKTGEFVVSAVTAVINLCVAVISAVIIIKGKGHDDE